MDQYQDLLNLLENNSNNNPTNTTAGPDYQGYLQTQGFNNFESMVKESYALLRIKYHKKNRYSYTVAFRMKCDSSEDTEFLTALNKIY